MTRDTDGRDRAGGLPGAGREGGDDAVALALIDVLDDDRLETCVASGDIDRVMDGDAAARARAEAHARECALCRESLALFDAVAGEGAVDLAAARRARAVSPDRRGRRWGRLLALAAAGALVGGVALLLSEPADGPLTAKGGPDGGDAVVAVGGAEPEDALHVAVMRDGLVFRASAGSRVVEGDALRLFHSSRAPGFLMVVNVDAAYARTVLLPHDGARSVPIAAGDEIALPGGALVGEGSGCEWLVAVFSDAPLAVDAVDAAIAAARAVGDPGACELRVAVPGARTVAVVPVRR